jgi:hypothetical protein
LFKKVLDDYRERVFVKNAVPKTAQIVEELFSSSANQEKYVCIKAIKQKGPEAAADFRKQMVNEVFRIVHDANPVNALRKSLIENIELDRKSRLLLTDEFRDRRQLIFDHLNKSITEPALRWSDSRAAAIAIRSEAATICLRHLQKTMVEKGPEGDWWARYLFAYNKYVESLYRSILTRADGQKGSIYEVEAEENRKVVDNLKLSLAGISMSVNGHDEQEESPL